MVMMMKARMEVAAARAELAMTQVIVVATEYETKPAIAVVGCQGC